MNQNDNLRPLKAQYAFMKQRIIMTMLEFLKLVPSKKSNFNNAFLKRRRKLIAKIDEQIQLATDSNYKPTKIKCLIYPYNLFN